MKKILLVFAAASIILALPHGGADIIWNAADGAVWAASPPSFGDSYSRAPAVNPIVNEGGATGISGTRNYFDRFVPEPASVLLIGFGLIVLASYRLSMKRVR